MTGRQNHDSFSGTLKIRGRHIMGIQTGERSLDILPFDNSPRKSRMEKRMETSAGVSLGFRV